jgi:hypothetical protein
MQTQTVIWPLLPPYSWHAGCSVLKHQHYTCTPAKWNGSRGLLYLLVVQAFRNRRFLHFKRPWNCIKHGEVLSCHYLRYTSLSGPSLVFNRVSQRAAPSCPASYPSPRYSLRLSPLPEFLKHAPIHWSSVVWIVAHGEFSGVSVLSAESIG